MQQLGILFLFFYCFQGQLLCVCLVELPPFWMEGTGWWLSKDTILQQDTFRERAEREIRTTLHLGFGRYFMD
ncbi:unnamed protein product [Ectocarpus sp. 12 AP-2014]